MPPPSADRPVERPNPARRWLAPALLLTLAPKCILCLLAYAGLSAALGLGGPEICGAPDDPTAPWMTWLSALGLVAGAVIFFAHSPKRRA